MRKKIIMFFNKKKPDGDPFKTFGKKRKVYYDFFKKGCLFGFDMYLASREENYKGGIKFENPYLFDGNKFNKTKSVFNADAIFDRSGGLKFPTEKISKKVLNCLKFKSICHNKNKMYSIIGKFMPKSFKIKNQKEFERRIRHFSENELLVVKPAEGLGGKGIIIKTAADIRESDFTVKKETVLQKFVDTSNGIEGVINGKHDLRVVIVGGKIIFASVRKPKKGTYLANVAQGGTIKEMSLKKIPYQVRKVVKEIQKNIDKKFFYPIYSIDFGVENGKPFVFELNDQIGFPSEKMKSYKIFNEALIKSLKEISFRKA